MLGLSPEIFLQGTDYVFVALRSNVSVCGERSWKDGNESEGGFYGLVQQVAHFLLEVLAGDDWVLEWPNSC